MIRQDSGRERSVRGRRWAGSRTWRRSRLAFGLMAMLVCSCGTAQNNPAASDSPNALQQAAPQVSQKVGTWVGGAGCHGSGALAQLWRERTSAQVKSDYPVGPGDLIDISVIGVQELKDQQVRVSGDGTIAMPFVGSFFVEGMTQDELRSKVAAKLKIYIKDPRVSVFVRSYASRTMAIMGLVEKPGRYVLISPSESILQVFGQAGGITSNASENILLVPAEKRSTIAGASNTHTDACTVALNDFANKETGGVGDYCPRGADYSPQPMPQEIQNDAIEINLNNPADQACLSVPARPGDLVIVPQAGEVEVAGWVQKPGSIKVQPGMTVLSAISAAGGALFSNDVELLKTDPDGRRTHTSFNLSDIRKGRAADVPVKSGDLIYVKASAVGAIPYTVEQLFQRFGTGMMIPIP